MVIVNPARDDKMNAIEKHYREFPRNQIAIRYFVNELIQMDRVLEATHYLNYLLKEDPKNIAANKLGYRLAIRRMEANVSKFDQQLHRLGVDKEEIYSLQLSYYFTFGIKKETINCAHALIDMEIKSSDTLNILIEVIEDVKNYALTYKFIKYHYSRIKTTKTVDKILKKIIFHRFCEVISKHINRH